MGSKYAHISEYTIETQIFTAEYSKVGDRQNLPVIGGNLTGAGGKCCRRCLQIVRGNDLGTF